jgi:hypothetical protein
MNIPKPHQVLEKQEIQIPQDESTSTLFSGPVAGPSSPTWHGNAPRTSSYKGKSRDTAATQPQMIPTSRRPAMVREVGSATISLRQGAVDLLESDGSSEEVGDEVELDLDTEGDRDGEEGMGRIEKERRSPRKSRERVVRKTFKDLLAGHGHGHRHASTRSTPLSPSKSQTQAQSHSHPRIHSQPQSVNQTHASLANNQSRSPERTRTHSIRSPALASSTTSGPVQAQHIRLSLNRNFTLPSQTSQSQSFQRRRARANSLHFPSETPSADLKNKNNKDFYLSHYSTDRAYSLEPTKKQINLELGLGDDFDHSFGEAMRKGLQGEEMQLPQQALRVLSEAKENMDLRLVGKQGRKGSLGMGLFKESRDGGDSKKRVRVKEQTQQALVVPEELEEAVMSDSDPLSPTLFRSSTATTPRDTRQVERDSIILPPALPIPITDSLRREPATDVENISQTTASLQLISPRDQASPQKSGHKSDIFSDESGWTTTDSDDSGSSSDGVGRGSKDSKDEMESTDEDEGESMTVPLQPFNHAVGGHSSIYKFTRRAVCKVGLVSTETREELMYSHWSVGRIYFMKRSKDSLRNY